MPLVKVPHTEAERKAMIAAGVNPDEIEEESINTDEYEDVASNVDIVKPTINVPQMFVPPPIDSLSNVNKFSFDSKPVVDNSAPSEIGSFTRSAAANVAPSTAAFGAGVVGAELGTPFFPPFGSIVGALATSIPTYIGAKKAQDALLPQTWLDTLKKDVETNPKSSFAGSLLGQTPTMRVSSTSLRDVIRGVPNALKSQASQQEVKAIANTILGGGIAGTGAAVTGVPDYIEGKTTGWDLTKDIARSSILGALQNKPTQLGESINRGGKNIVDALRFKFNPNTTYVPPVPPVIKQQEAAKPAMADEPIIDVEGQIVRQENAQPKLLDYHTPETESALQEAQAKIKKTQEDTLKLQEETTRIQEEHRVAQEAKNQAVQELVQAAKGNEVDSIKPVVAESLPINTTTISASSGNKVEVPTTPAAIFTGVGLNGNEYKIQHDVVDPVTNEIIHPANSTLNESKLEKYNIPFVKPTEQEIDEVNKKNESERILQRAKNEENLNAQEVSQETKPQKIATLPKEPSIASQETQDSSNKDIVPAKQELPIKSVNFQNKSLDEPNFTRVEQEYPAPALAEKSGPPSTIPPANQPPAIIPPNNNTPGGIPPVDDPYIPEIDLSRQGFLKGGAPQFDKIRQFSVPVAEAFHNAKTDSDALIGRFVNVPISKLMALKPTKEEMEHVMKAMNQAYRDSVIRDIPPKIDLGLSEREEAIRKIIMEVNAAIPTEAKKRDMKINGRFTIDNPNINYISAMVDPERLHEANKNPHGVEARRYARLYANYLQDNFPEEFPKTELGYAKARKEWTDYIAAVNGDKSPASVDFGPLHKAQGYGLPDELQDWNLPRVLTRYGNNAARDMAFHTHFKQVPNVAGPLRLRHRGSGKLINEDERHTDLSGNKEVIGAFKHLSGDFNYGNPTIAAATRVVTSHMIGLMTGIGDIVSTPMNMLPYMDKMGSDIISSVKGLASLNDAYKRSLATNARQRKLDVRLWGNMEAPGQPVVQMIQKYADMVRILQVREATDQLSKVIPFSTGREMAKVRVMDYLKTKNADSRKWLEKFGRNVDLDALYPSDKVLINIQLDQIAKNFSDRVSGSYGGDQLPVGVMDGWYAPFSTLTKWSHAKANVAFQDILKPAYTKQEYGPLLRYMLVGMPIAYGLFRTLQELFTHKKSSEATLKETLEKGNLPDMMAYLANVMAVSSFFGIASYPIKAMSDIAIKYQFPTFSLNNPLLEFIGEVAVKNFLDASEAIAEGEDPLRTIGSAIMQMFKQSTQNLRMLSNQTVGREDVERSNKIRDLKVFNQLGSAKDNPDRPRIKRQVGLDTNPLLDIDEKEFKRTSDMNRALEMIPDLLKKIDAEAQGNEEKKHRLIQNLMKDNYPTFPSLHTSQASAKQAVEYTKYLINVYGREEALARVNDYLEHEKLQQEKNKMLMKEAMKSR